MKLYFCRIGFPYYHMSPAQLYRREFIWYISHYANLFAVTREDWPIRAVDMADQSALAALMFNQRSRSLPKLDLKELTVS